MILVLLLFETSVKSGSSALKSNRGSGRGMGVSHRGGPEV